MKATLRYFPVGCADTTLIELPDGRLVLIDFADFGDPLNPSDKRIELSKALKKLLDERDRDYIDVVAFTHLDDDHVHKASEFFWFEHADKYQDDERIKINQLWVPAAAITEVGSENDAWAIRQEARHRLKNGKGIRVFSRPERLKDWLAENGLSPEDRQHLITDAGRTVPGFSVDDAGHVEFFVHSPFAWRLNDAEVEDRNGDLFAFQARFLIGGNETRVLFFSDLAHESLTQIVETTKRHKREGALLWDVAKAPHHCSYLSLSDEKGTDKTVPVKDVAWIWEDQGQEGCIIVSSSPPIPEKNTKADKDKYPPHRQAANYYREVIEDKDGEFLVTMDHPNQFNPRPVVIEIGASGAMVLKTVSVGTSAIVATPARAGSE
ncbi:MAG: hypothetical protein RLN84_08310 [Rhodospirillaceae bacterium]